MEHTIADPFATGQRRRVVITGAGGQLGCALAEEFPEARTFTRADWDVDYPPPADLVGTDLVLHAAAWTDVDGAEDDPQGAAAVNVGGVRNAASLGAPLVVWSSDYVFDGTKSSPYVESDAPSPANAYGRTKLLGEAAAGPEAWVIRTSWLFGWTSHNFVRTILRLAAEQRELAVIGDQIGCPTYTGHLAKATRDVLELPYGTYHVAAAGECSWAELAEAIVEEAGLDATVRRISSAEYGGRAARPAYSVLRSERGAPVLPHWRVGLRECLDRLGVRLGRDPGEEGDLHLLRTEPSMLAVELLDEVARLVPEDRFAVAWKDDDVAEPGPEVRRRCVEGAGGDERVDLHHVSDPVESFGELVANLALLPVADMQEEIAARAGRCERLSVRAGLEVGGELWPQLVDVDGACRVDRRHPVIGGQQDQRSGGERCMVDEGQRRRECFVRSRVVRAAVVHQTVDLVQIDDCVTDVGRRERVRSGGEALPGLREREHVRSAQEDAVRRAEGERSRLGHAAPNALLGKPSVERLMRVDVLRIEHSCERLASTVSREGEQQRCDQAVQARFEQVPFVEAVRGDR